MGEVAAVAGAVTTIITGVDKLVQRQDANDARLEAAVADLRSPLPDPVPLASFDVQSVLQEHAPAGTVVSVLDVGAGTDLVNYAVAEPIAQKLFGATARAAAKNPATTGRVRLALVVIPNPEGS